jgi:hypothetical protein
MSSIQEINALEIRITTAEDDADAMLWEQAGLVVAQLEANVSVRQLAKDWINARTGLPYSRGHVYWTKLTHGQHAGQCPRPLFRKAYEALAHAKTAKSKRAEPFHWLLAVGDLRKTVEKIVNTWPVESRALAPRALRTLAAQLESEGIDASRRDRITGTGPRADTATPNGVARAS